MQLSTGLQNQEHLGRRVLGTSGMHRELLLANAGHSIVWRCGWGVFTSRKSDLVMRRMPSTQSSMYVKDRVCWPSPHISISSELVSTFRQNAAGAFSRPPFHVPYGPA